MSADADFLRKRLKRDKRWRWFWMANLPLALILPAKVRLPYLIGISVWALVESRTASIANDETAIDACTDSPGPTGD